MIRLSTCPICDSLNIAPLRLSAYMDTIDVLFVPGEGYTGPQDREFKEDVRYNIRNVYFKLDKVMDGDLDDITEALVKHYHEQKLSGSQ